MLVTFLILCPLPLYEAVRASLAGGRCGQIRGGKVAWRELRKSSHFDSKIINAWEILAAILVKSVCVCVFQI